MSREHLNRKLYDLQKACDHMTEAHGSRLYSIMLEDILHRLHAAAGDDTKQYLIEKQVFETVKNLGYTDDFGYYREPKA